ncbi:MAG: CtsR family transcriptional regulator [Christensenellales bacterium]
MSRLSDTIENFIKEMMTGDTSVEFKRNELAQHFGCAPSQINYVLATRFSIEHGYIIESKRGGGGFVKVLRMSVPKDGNLLDMLLRRIDNQVDEDTAVAIIRHVYERDIVTLSEAKLMRVAVGKNALALPISAKDILRAAVLKCMLTQAFRNREERKNDDV